MVLNQIKGIQMEEEFEVTEEQEETEKVGPFIEEDVEESLKACALCAIQRPVIDGKQFICVTFNARNKYALRNKQEPIEDTFYCTDFQSAE